MRPIQYKVDNCYHHALRCAEYRLPRDPSLTRQAYLLALGLRFGVIGIAGTQQLLQSAGPEDQAAIRTAARAWPQFVSDHIRYHASYRMPIHVGTDDLETIGKYADEVLSTYLQAIPYSGPLGLALDDATQSFTCAHKAVIYAGWPWFRRTHANAVFRRSSHESLRFAALFYERRQADIEEVPEIALLGE